MAKTVLTVDDSASIRQMVSFTLKSAGYEVVEAVEDAAQAVEEKVAPKKAPAKRATKASKAPRATTAKKAAAKDAA